MEFVVGPITSMKIASAATAVVHGLNKFLVNASNTIDWSQKEKQILLYIKGDVGSDKIMADVNSMNY
jgi:hypothetical protein